MARPRSVVGFGLLLGVCVLVLAACGGSSSKATATHAANAPAAGTTASTSGNDSSDDALATATAPKYHVGDAESVRIDGNKVQATLVKIYDPATNPVFWPGISSDLTTGDRYVGIEMTFTNQSQQPEALGQARILQPLDKQFDAVGQLSGGGADNSANHFTTSFDGCTPTDDALTLAPGASATYCVTLKVPTGAQVIEVDWNGIDSNDDEARWSVP
jgi:hypothetical protein